MHNDSRVVEITQGENRAGRFVGYRNNDAWSIAPGESKVLADIKGPGAITHIWLMQRNS